MLPNLSPEEYFALQKAMKLCASEERSPFYIRQKFYQWGLSKEQSERLIHHLLEQNFLNEQRFADAFVRGKFKIKGWGKVKIKAELQSRGISSQAIHTAFQQFETESYQDTLKQLAQKKLKSLKNLSPAEQRPKLIRYLLSKGYEYEAIIEILGSNSSETSLFTD